MSKIPQNAKGSATAPTVPSHDPINSDPGDEMNAKRYTTADLGKELSSEDRVKRAAMWLAEQINPPRPIVPHLRREFDLCSLEASAACVLAQKYRIARVAHG